MTPPNTTPLNEELDKIFGELIPVKWSTASYPIIPPKQLVHAKQELTNLIQTLEKKAKRQGMAWMHATALDFIDDPKLIEKLARQVEHRLSELGERGTAPNNTTTRSKE